MPKFAEFVPSSPLPSVGIAYERATLDLKRTYLDKGTRPPRFEMAKDVAAFANAIGGTILVGIQEGHPSGTVARYAPLSDDEATAHTKAIQEAVDHRCRPRPLVQIERIPCNSLVVLAVNVWPYPPGCVAVLAEADPSADHGGKSWVFPLRLNESTTYLEPEQLSMLMDPKVRRIAILLSHIPKNALCTVQRLSGDGRGPSRVTFDSFNLQDNSVTFTGIPGAGTGFTASLDQVITIWRDASVNEWRAVIVPEVRMG